MSIRPTSALLALIAAVGIGPVSRGDESLPAPLINSVGSHRLFDGKLTLRMLEKGDFIIYKGVFLRVRDTKLCVCFL